MTDAFEPHEERDLEAAEYVLGLVEGEALLAARGRLASDPGFAAEVAAWERRFEPMYDGFEAVAPPEHVWSRIEAALPAQGGGGVEPIVRFKRRERLWKGYAAGMTALAAGLALLLGLRIAQPDAPVAPPQRPAPAAEAPLLVAALASEDGDAALAVTVSADRRSVLVAPTRMATVRGHSHELWLIRASGTPVSLGVIAADAPRRHSISAELAGEVRAQAALAVSVEPTGGSPTGLPTGPVIASASLRQI